MRADRERNSVLVHAPIGRDGPATAELLRRVGLSATVCSSLTNLTAGMEAGAAAVFIAEEGLFGKDLTALTAWVANQPPWSDLPFIVLTSRQEQPAVAAWRQRLIASLRNVSLLERPVQAITLTSTVQAAVRARLRQYEVRALLEVRERTTAELEAAVVARTSELEEANRELRKEMAERARVEETLRQAQKMEVVGQLTGGVAHDFNNLLMVISSGLTMLERHDDPERRRQLIGRMREAVQRGAGLTHHLLAFSRQQALKSEPVDLAYLIGGMRDLLNRSLRGDVQVRLEFADGLWPVEVDPGELELAVLNLAVNARDAMPEGGTIIVRAENAPGEPIDDRAVDCVRLSIIDTGTGMPPEVQARAFEPFFTTKDVGKGSGLGLAQVYGFARQSVGTVRIVSSIGQGTVVAVLLPRSAKPPMVENNRAAEPRVESRAAGSAGCVLLVEDDDEVAALVAEMLDQLGYQVTRAATAEAALGALANARKIDLVFSDVMMPGMSGVELAREVRRRRCGIPVLLTSGYAEAVRHAAEAEGIPVLPKPYQLEELAAALRLTRGPVLHGGRADRRLGE